ncbi:MAG: DUF5661 family protein [Paraclostridium sp.]
MKFNAEDAIKALQTLKYDIDNLPFTIEDFTYGMNVELEHGTELGKNTNVTNNNYLDTAKIALAHMKESPKYYKELKKMEVKLEKKASTIKGGYSMNDNQKEILRKKYSKKFKVDESNLSDEDLQKINQSDAKKTLKRVGGLYAGATGASMIGKAHRSGDIDGVKKMYHLTSDKNVKDILEKGLKAPSNPGELTASGLHDSISTGHIKIEDLANKTYLANNKNTVNAIKTGKKMNGISDIQKNLKVNMPLSELKGRITSNPEVLGAKNGKEFVNKKKQVMLDYKKNGGWYLNTPSDSQLKASYKLLSDKGTTVIDGDVASKFIKGSKDFDKNTAKKVMKHIAENPGKFVKGTGTLGAGALVTGAGAKLLYDGMKKRTLDDIRENEKVASSMEDIQGHPAFIDFWKRKKKNKKKDIEKKASFSDDIEKIAARAWKSRLGQIGEDGINKLVDSGVLDRTKELKGLRRGTQNIAKKEHTKLFRNPEHAAGYTTRATKEHAKKLQGIDISPSDAAAFKDQVANMGPFGSPMSHYPGKMFHTAHVQKNAYPKAKKMVNSQLSQFGADVKKDGMISIPRKDKESKKWAQALLERHEIDETRFGSRAMNNKKTSINTPEHGWRPTTNFSSHMTPKVVAAESANVAVAPKNARDAFTKMRRLNESTIGHANTEVGALKDISGGRIDYGKSGNYDKKGANKAEKHISNIMKPYFE